MPWSRDVVRLSVSLHRHLPALCFLIFVQACSSQGSYGHADEGNVPYATVSGAREDLEAPGGRLLDVAIRLRLGDTLELHPGKGFLPPVSASDPAILVVVDKANGRKFVGRRSGRADLLITGQDCHPLIPPGCRLASVEVSDIEPPSTPSTTASDRLPATTLDLTR